MLDTGARREAISIAIGEEPREPVNDKVLMYGILGRAFKPEDLKDLFGNQPEPTSFIELAAQLKDSLKQVAIYSYDRLGIDGQDILERLFAQKYPQANFDMFGRDYPGTPFPLERMLMGAVSAAEREVMVLRTIAKKVNEGNVLTSKGLSASVRVPLQLALVHLFDLEVERETQQRWSIEEGGDGGIILPEGIISYDPHKGLYLTTLPVHPDERLKDEYGPQIGCPVSFIKKYIQTIHESSARSAVESGLLS